MTGIRKRLGSLLGPRGNKGDGVRSPRLGGASGTVLILDEVARTEAGAEVVQAKQLGNVMGPGFTKAEVTAEGVLVLTAKDFGTGAETPTPLANVRGGQGLPGTNGVATDDAVSTLAVTSTKTRGAMLGVGRQAAEQALFGPRLGNQLMNPSFETSTAGWTITRGTIARVTTPESLLALAAGLYVGLIMSDGTSTTTELASVRLPATPGSWVTARVAAAVDAGVQARAQVVFRDAGGATLTTVGGAYSAPTAGAWLETVQQVPANAATYEVGVRLYSGSGTMNLAVGAKGYVDAFSTTHQPTDTQARTMLSVGYRDGDSPGWRWTSTTHASASESVQFATSGNLDIFVSQTGSDSNDGAAGRPVATLRRAVELIPAEVLNGHVVTVYVAPGDWNETLRLEHRDNSGKILLVGQGALRTDTRFNQVIITAISGYVELIHVAVKERFSQAQFWFARCPYAIATDCEGMGDPASDIQASGRIGFLSDEGTNLLIRGGSRATYKRYFARANYLSRIHSVDNDLSVDAAGNPTNTFGIAARHGAIATIYGTAPRGVENDQSTDTGGLVVAGRGFRYDQSEEGLVDSLTSVNSAPLEKSWMFRRKNVPGITNFDATNRFRMTFDAMISDLAGAIPQLGPIVIDVQFAAQVSAAQSIYQQKRIIGNITSTAFVLAHQEVIAERLPTGYAGDASTIITAVNQSVRAGRFSVDLSPKIVTLADLWAVKITITHMGNAGAPVLVLFG